MRRGREPGQRGLVDREAGTSVTGLGCHATVHTTSDGGSRLHSFDEARTDGDTKLRQRRIGNGRRCCRRCLACVAAQIACIATIAGTVILSSERPVLRLQQIIGHPQSWLIDAINPRNPRGYAVSRVPAPLRQALADFAASAPPGTAYSGSCRHGCTIGPGELEDYIISGPTRFSRVPPRLAAAAERELRPLLERFCACRLQVSEQVSVVRLRALGPAHDPRASSLRCTCREEGGCLLALD